MSLKIGNAQHQGVRKEQQDAFGWSQHDNAFVERAGMLGVVADGMGGMAMGRDASQIAVRTFLQTYVQQATAGFSIPDALYRALQEANGAVYALAQEAGLAEDVGTTCIAAVIKGAGLYWIAAGDSRIYLCRDEQLTQLNEDHIYANELLREVSAGHRARETVEQDPQRMSLTSFLGMETIAEIDRSLRPFSLQPGDRVLLCSDGIHNMLSEAEIAHILQQQPPQEAASTLVERVQQQQHPQQDNMTALVLGYRLDEARLEAPTGVRPVPPLAAEHTPVASAKEPRGRKLLMLSVALVAAVAVLGWFYPPSGWLPTGITDIFPFLKPDEESAPASVWLLRIDSVAVGQDHKPQPVNQVFFTVQLDSVVLALADQDSLAIAFTFFEGEDTLLHNPNTYRGDAPFEQPVLDVLAHANRLCAQLVQEKDSQQTTLVESCTEALPADHDGDGLSSALECPKDEAFEQHGQCRNTNPDRIPDFLDPDDDADGMETRLECPDPPECPTPEGQERPYYLDPRRQPPAAAEPSPSPLPEERAEPPDSGAAAAPQPGEPARQQEPPVPPDSSQAALQPTDTTQVDTTQRAVHRQMLSGWARARTGAVLSYLQHDQN